uniref:Uncharacterized protein n=1 Tax=Amphilophus citrinellus TaxID=61819 RepID=A0A3Q0SHF1_AMPCI
STLGSGSLHCVRLLALMAQGVLFDELVARAAVQVAAHTPNDDGGADVMGLYPHLPTDSRATSLCNGQAITFTTTASPILKSQGQIFSGGLVHFLICTAMIGLEDHSQSGEPLKPKCMSSRGPNPTLCSKVSQNLFPPTSPHRNSM